MIGFATRLGQKERMMERTLFICVFLSLLMFLSPCQGESATKLFRVIAFHNTSLLNDYAHIYFTQEADKWFENAGYTNGFIYESTGDYNNFNDQFLARYDVVMFLEEPPLKLSHRNAFEKYMKNGGSFFGLHYCALRLIDNEARVPNWSWFHDEFLGSGDYVSSIWRAVPAVLRVENKDHPATSGFPDTIISTPNEWYNFSKDLRLNPNITILMSIDNSSFPVGTKPDQTWHSGYYPTVWTNKNYRMLYVNMGHDDFDYEGDNSKMSSSFSSPRQNQLYLKTLDWLGRKGQPLENNELVMNAQVAPVDSHTSGTSRRNTYLSGLSSFLV